jgi:hypothetical protein
MPKGFLEELLRKPVVVRANGITYRGILLEVATEAIVVRTQMSQVSIPMDRVTSVIDPNAPSKKGPLTFIDPSYYR